MSRDMAETARTVILRGWPGLDDWKAGTRPRGYSARLGERNALVVHAAADLGAPGDTFGIGAAILVAGPTVVSGVLVVADDLKERDPAAFEAIATWAATHRLVPKLGSRTWEVCSASEFFDPFARADGEHIAFAPDAYGANKFVVAFDAGRFFGLVAEHAARVVKASSSWRGGWSIYPPGWGAQREDGTWYRASPHRPELKLLARRVGWQMGWGACKAGYGHEGGGGECIDLATLAYALDSDRAAGYRDHREHFGLARGEPLPLSVRVDEAGASEVAGAVLGLHELALALDHEAGRWFASEEERAEGRGRLSLSRTASPGAIAGQLLGRFGLRAPLEQFNLSDDEHRAWAESFHGGRFDGDETLYGVPLPMAQADLTSAFPMTASLLGWWELVCAERLDREDVTQALLDACKAAVKDPAVVLDREVWERFGASVCEVIPDGEPWPIALDDEHRPDGRTELVPVWSPGRAMRYAWPDVAAAAILAGRVPKVARATRLVPIGRQSGLRSRAPLRNGTVLAVAEDPAVAIVRLRQEVKNAGDKVLAAELRVAVNSLAYGNMCRFDEVPSRKGELPGERPGPWTFLPVAASVTAGSRLLLAAFERLVTNRGGSPVYAATDAWHVVASPEGCPVDLPDGRSIRALSYSEVDEIVATFDQLRVFGADIPVWKVSRGSESQPSQGVVFGPMRHAELLLGDDGPELTDSTESGLGETFVAPPRHPTWSGEAVEREVRRVLGLPTGPAPWDDHDGAPFPAIRRRSVASPEVLTSLPPELGARPGSVYLVADRHPFLGTKHGEPVALDRGSDLADWADLAWHDRQTGEAIRVSTDPRDLGARQLETLSSKARDFARRSGSEPIVAVSVDPDLVEHRGRVSGVLDAEDMGLPGDLRSHRPVYDAARRLEAVEKRAAALGPRAFARRTGVATTVAKRAAAGEPISGRNASKALRALEREGVPISTCAAKGCGEPVFRQGARYCSERCRDRAKKARRRAEARAHPAARNLPPAPLPPAPIPRRGLLTRFRARLSPPAPKPVLPACALEGCTHPVGSPGARYCACPDHGSHREAAKKRRQRARRPIAPDPSTGMDPAATKQRKGSS